MTKRTLIFTIISTLSFIACNSTKNERNTKQESKTETVKSVETDVPFTEAKNYFVKNTYKDGELSNPKISTQADFDKIFGMATTMGENGKPTPIDFSKQFVVAVIGQTTDKATKLSVNSLKKIDHSMTLTYTQIEGEKQTYFILPVVLLIIDNQFKGEVMLQKK